MSGASLKSSSNSVIGGGGGGGAISKDFSVDAQRRMFIEKQALEKQLADEARMKRSSTTSSRNRRHGTKKSSPSNQLSRNGSSGGGAVGNDDDDDSINNNNDNDDDEFSLDSEESFYVGIERADYTQPDNLTLYKGDDYCADGKGQEHDRLGISHVSIAIINRQQQQQQQQGENLPLDWDADIPILTDEKSHHGSSLYEFMNGRSPTTGAVGGKSKKNGDLVAMPLVGSSGSGTTTNLLAWNEDHILNNDAKRGGCDDDSDKIDQVYQHKAAEGKMFIDKILSATTETSDADAASPMIRSTAAASRVRGDGGGGTYPKLSPLQMYIPGLASTGRGKGGGDNRTAVGEGEETNFMRQMRERELRKEENALVAARTMQEMRAMIAATTAAAANSTDADSAEMTMVDANTLMKKLEELMTVE